MKKIILLLFIFVNNMYSNSIEKHLTVVVPSYNNSQWYKKNLDSIFCQKYQNYKIIYIDDCSTDGTADLVEEYTKERNMTHKLILIRNKERRLALANWYNTVHSLDDLDIVITLDGDDWFSNDEVLSYFNKVYQNPNIWFTYGQFKRCPKDTIGYCRPVSQEEIDQKLLRGLTGKHFWTPGQPRSFYAWIFKQIKLIDLIVDHGKYKGDFFPTNCDVATCVPIIEMCGNNFKFISKILYIYNNLNPINDFKVNLETQKHFSKVIRSKPPYATLTKPIIGRLENLKNNKADLIIISETYDIEDLINSTSEKIKNINNIFIVYKKTSLNPFTQFNKKSSNMEFIEYTHLDDTLMQCLDKCKSNYIMLAEDNLKIIDNIDANNLIIWLERTFAFNFSLALSKIINIPSAKLTEGVRAWNLKFAENPKLISNLDMKLFRKKDLFKNLSHMKFDNLSELKIILENTWKNQNRLGLYFKNPKLIIN